MLADVIARVTALRDKGLNADAIVAAKPTAGYDAKWGGGFMKPDAFVRTVADSLIDKPQAHFHEAGDHDG